MRFEERSLASNFWRFIAPSVAAQWIYALYTMVDGAFVSHGVGETALAAVNLSSPFLSLLFSVALLFAMGTSTVVSIFLGQGNHEEANQAYTRSLIALGVVSAVLTLGAVVFLHPLAVFLGATESTMEYVQSYLLSLIPFVGFFTFSYSFEVLVKTDGYPKLATIAALIGALTNCVLDFLFVLVFHWGVAGAGVATGLSQALVTGIYLIHFFSSRATIRLAKPQWHWCQLGRVLKNGLPSGLTELSAGITVFLFNHVILSVIGEEGIISYTVIAYVNTLVIMTMAGIAQGSQPLISFYYGKGEHQRCNTLLRYSLTASMGAGVIAFIISLAGARALAGFFINPELTDLLDATAAEMKIFSVSFLLAGITVSVSGFFTAIEWPKSALTLSLGRGVVVIALALFFSAAVWGAAGIWWAATLSEAICGTAAIGMVLRYLKKIKSMT